MLFFAELEEVNCIEETERQAHFESMDYPNLENLASAMEIEDDIMKDIFMQQTLA